MVVMAMKPIAALTEFLGKDNNGLTLYRDPQINAKICLGKIL